MELNTEAFKIFYEVARQKNITKAAEKLFISQPAVTQTIKKLENDLDVTLFLRNKKGVELTRIGEEIFEKVESAMVTFESVEKTLKEYSGLLCGEVTVSCGINVGKKVLIGAIEEFVSAYPKVNIVQTNDVQARALERLRKGEIDLLITQHNNEVEDLTFKKLYNETYVLVKSPRPEFENNDLRFITTGVGAYSNKLFSEFIKSRGLEDAPIVRVSSYNMLFDLCKLGVGVGILPHFLADEEIQKNELEVVFDDYEFSSVDYGVYYNEKNLTRAAKEFLKMLIMLNA